MSLYDGWKSVRLREAICNFSEFVYIKEKNNRLRNGFWTKNTGKYQKMDLTKRVDYAIIRNRVVTFLKEI